MGAGFSLGAGGGATQDRAGRVRVTRATSEELTLSADRPRGGQAQAGTVAWPVREPRPAIVSATRADVEGAGQAGASHSNKLLVNAVAAVLASRLAYTVWRLVKGRRRGGGGRPPPPPHPARPPTAAGATVLGSDDVGVWVG